VGLVKKYSPFTVYSPVHNSPPLLPIFNQTNPVNILLFYLFVIRFNIIFLSTTAATTVVVTATIKLLGRPKNVVRFTVKEHMSAPR
jgi:hypothetical protein